MLFKITLTMMMLTLSGCSLLPGLQNPDTSQMNKIVPAVKIKINPTLIPITPELIADQQSTKYIYRIAPADVLNITVWQHPELSQNEMRSHQGMGLPSTQGAAGQEGYLVNPNGYIHYPLIGSILVAEKSVDEIRVSLTKKLRKYIKNPDLNVRVVDFRSRKVYVLGEVLKPGFIPINDQPLSIADAIVMTGGLDPNAADPSHIYVIRGSIDRPCVYLLNARAADKLLLAEYFNLQPGDILFVSSAPATRWNRVINQLLPTIQTIWYTKAIVDARYR